MRAGQALKIMNEKGAHTCAQTAVIHIKYIYTGYTGRMKMHLKCNNKNDNGIIILYKGTQAEKESKREKERDSIQWSAFYAHARKYATLFAAR